jgi:hypothetical protein
VRGYQERSAPSAIPATAGQADGRAVCICVARLAGMPAHAELRALSWRISIHALEYSLTISPLYGARRGVFSHRFGRKSDHRIGVACNRCRVSNVSCAEFPVLG